MRQGVGRTVDRLPKPWVFMWVDGWLEALQQKENVPALHRLRGRYAQRHHVTIRGERAY